MSNPNWNYCNGLGLRRKNLVQASCGRVRKALRCGSICGATNMHEFYENPLVERYAGKRMARLWSSQVRVSTWRRLWVSLAEAQRGLGLNVSEQQIAALRAQVEAIDFDA